MSAYAELTYLIGAMVIFGFLSLNTARSFNSSRQSIYQAEAEYRAIAVAQDELDKVQWIYDSDELDPNSTNYVYENYPVNEIHNYGAGDEYNSTFLINGTSELVEDTGSMKTYQITVSVLNQNVTPEAFITLEYVKSYNY